MMLADTSSPDLRGGNYARKHDDYDRKHACGSSN